MPARVQLAPFPGPPVSSGTEVSPSCFQVPRAWLEQQRTSLRKICSWRVNPKLKAPIVPGQAGQLFTGNIPEGSTWRLAAWRDRQGSPRSQDHVGIAQDIGSGAILSLSWGHAVTALLDTGAGRVLG